MSNPTPTDARQHLLDAIADADKFRSPSVTISIHHARAIADVLKPADKLPRRPDPFFPDAERLALMADLSAIQTEVRPDRAPLRQTPQRLSALGHATEIYDESTIRDTWRWWLGEWPDEYKGRWFDTFLDKLTSYIEAFESSLTQATPDPDAGKFTIPKIASTEDAAAELMRKADNAGLEGGAE